MMYLGSGNSYLIFMCAGLNNRFYKPQSALLLKQFFVVFCSVVLLGENAKKYEGPNFFVGFRVDILLFILGIQLRGSAFRKVGS